MLRAWPHAVGTGTVAAARASMCPGLQLWALATPLTLGQGGSRRASAALSPGDSRAQSQAQMLVLLLHWAGAQQGSTEAPSRPPPAQRCSSLVPSTWPCQLHQWIWFRFFLRCASCRGHTHCSSTQSWGLRSSRAANCQPQLVRYRRACLFLLFNVCAFSSCGSVSPSSFCELKELEKIVWEVKDFIFRK